MPVAVGSIPGHTVHVGETATISLDRYFSDPDGDDLIYGAESSDEGVVAVSVSGGALEVAGVSQGSATVTVVATDAGGLSAEQGFTATVPNQSPELSDSISDAEVFVGDVIEVSLSEHFSDPDGDPLSYLAESSDPATATVSVSGGALEVAGVSQGSARVTVVASDAGGLSAEQGFTVTVPNRAPEPSDSISDAEVFVGDAIEVSLSEHFSDPDGDPLSYLAESSDPATATVTVSGDTLEVAGVSQGSATVKAVATDAGGLSAEQGFMVTVPNRAPELSDSVPDAEVFVGDAIEVSLSEHFSDPDGDELSYVAESSDSATATVTVSGDTLEVAGVSQGSATVTVTATDAGGLSAKQGFMVTVPNRAPELSDSVPDAEVFVGDAIEVSLSEHFSDPDGDELSYGAESSDEGVVAVSVSGDTLRATGVAKGSASVTVVASDAGGLSAKQGFMVTVPNRTPELSDSISDAEVSVGDAIEVSLSEHFSDPDGDELSYGAESSDESVVVVPVSGDTLRATGVAKGSATVTVTATDPEGLSVEESFEANVVYTTRQVLEAFYHAAGGDGWRYRRNWLSDTDPRNWHGIDYDNDGIASISLLTNDMSGILTPLLGELTNLKALNFLINNLRGGIPPELGELRKLEGLTLARNPIGGSIPPELGNLTELVAFNMDRTDLEGSIPPELGGLGSVEIFGLAHNRLSGAIPAELGDMTAVRALDLNDNDLSGPIPPRLGDLPLLWRLNLSENRISGPIPPELGELPLLRKLHLNDNELSGPLPPELGELSILEELYLHGNPELSGPIPSSFANLTSLTHFYAHDTELCVPKELREWYIWTRYRKATLCHDADAYLVQSVQSLSEPVPLVAGKEALLRVFVTAVEATTETLPPATATFYVDDSESYEVDIDGTTETIPIKIAEESLAKSLNVVIPASKIEEGLELVIEIDPDSTIDHEILATTRIPESGRLYVGVKEVGSTELTLVPFLYTEDPDSSVIDAVEGMADDEEDHELLHPTYDLLPIGELAVKGHDPVEIDSDRILDVLIRTKAIRQAEGATDFWMGLMANPGGAAVGAAYISGKVSASRLAATTMAHELGHNFSLRHAPCGGPRGVDEEYPYEDGRIGAWGYDHRDEEVVNPSTKDLMSYCSPRWIGSYHFTAAANYRTMHRMEMRQGAERSLLVWGSRSASGELSMDPPLVVVGRQLLPDGSGDYDLTGRDDAGEELFSFSFDMIEPADAEEGTGLFVFLLPPAPGWESLASLVLGGSGPSSFVLDADSEATMAMVRDLRTGQVRAIRGDFAEPPRVPPGQVVRWSRGIPDREAWRLR